MTAQNLATVANDRKEYVLAEFRCAIVKANLALLDLEAAALALKAGFVTPEQAVAMFWDSQAVQFLGLEFDTTSSDAATALVAKDEVRT